MANLAMGLGQNSSGLYSKSYQLSVSAQTSGLLSHPVPCKNHCHKTQDQSPNHPKQINVVHLVSNMLEPSPNKGLSIHSPMSSSFPRSMSFTILSPRASRRMTRKAKALRKSRALRRPLMGRKVKPVRCCKKSLMSGSLARRLIMGLWWLYDGFITGFLRFMMGCN